MTPTLLEIDGAGVHPETVDPRVAADLISTFFDLLGKAARVRGVQLTLRGIRIQDKCLQLGCDTAEPEPTIQAMEVMSAWVEGKEQPDTQQELDSVRHFASVIEKFGEGATVRVAVGTWERSLEPSIELPDLPPQASTTLRVKLLHCGVKPARAHFESGSEKEPFSLPITTEQATELGHYIDKELDLVFTYRRNRFGRIDDGQIEKFYPMEVDDNGEDWLAWLTRNGRHWDDVKDHLEELGRRDD